MEKQEQKSDEMIKTVREFLAENCDTFSVEHSLIKDSDDYKIVKGALEYSKQVRQLTVDSFDYQISEYVEAMEQMSKALNEIKEYQMNYVELARTTELYQIAEKGLEYYNKFSNTK